MGVNVKVNKFIIIEIISILVVIGLLSTSYSFFNYNVSNGSVILGGAVSLGINLDVARVAPTDNKKLVPQLDSAITSAIKGVNGSNCIDHNGNAICQVYEIKVKNTSDATIYVDGLFYLHAGDNPNIRWTLINTYVSGMTINPSLVSSVNSQISKTITSYEKYAPSEEKKYYLVIWISETGNAQTDSGIFSGEVYFKTSDYLTPAATTLYSLGLAPNIDTPTFEKTSCSSGCEENTVGIYTAMDDLGMSYYFRGDVINNYVNFAEKYWRIIRINGDGTIRMIYDGTSAHANGESSTNRYVAKKAFKTSPYNDNTYVGYMYGNAGVTGSGEEAYYSTHSNLYDSTIKDYLENTWYPTISDADKEYIADAIYCNDRSLDPNFDYFTGIGTESTCYGAYARVFRFYDTDVNPILTCPLANDRFTLDSNNFEDVETNGKLSAPVGLLTADEIAFAGGRRTAVNKINYLYAGTIFWTMSPAYYVDYATNFAFHGNGFPNGFAVYGSQFAVRPVISLVSDAISSGTGTMTDPFVVS